MEVVIVTHDVVMITPAALLIPHPAAVQEKLIREKLIDLSVVVLMLNVQQY